VLKRAARAVLNVALLKWDLVRDSCRHRGPTLALREQLSRSNSDCGRHAK
jgi:phenylpropionate dioxygenase-like ring-hydroxylating dioxygenase large terminal subunit